MELVTLSREAAGRVGKAIRRLESDGRSEAAGMIAPRLPDPCQLVNVTGVAVSGEYPARLAFHDAAAGTTTYSDPVAFKPFGGAVPATDGSGYYLSRYSGPNADETRGLYVGVPASGGSPSVASDLIWPARITGGPTTGAYSWQRIAHNSGSTWVDDTISTPNSGTLDAFPVPFVGSSATNWGTIPTGARCLMWAVGSLYWFVPWPEASTAVAGLLSTNSQDILGQKTFWSQVVIRTGLQSLTSIGGVWFEIVPVSQLVNVIGNLNVQTGVYQYGGVPGITASKTVGASTVTISGGIITGWT